MKYEMLPSTTSELCCWMIELTERMAISEERGQRAQESWKGGSRPKDGLHSRRQLQALNTVKASLQDGTVRSFYLVVLDFTWIFALVLDCQKCSYCGSASCLQASFLGDGGRWHLGAQSTWSLFSFCNQKAHGYPLGITAALMYMAWERLIARGK